VKRDLTTRDFWDQRNQSRSIRASGLRMLLGDAFEGTRAEVWERLLARTCSAPGNILELGCAPGRILKRLAEVAPQHHYHGLDMSAPGLEACRSLLQEAGIHAELYEGDVWTAELPRKFDVVVSAGLIEHFSDLRGIVLRHAYYARPGGWVVVTVPNWARPGINRLITVTLRPNTFETHNAEPMEPENLKSTFESAGLLDVEAGEAGGAWLTTVAASLTVKARLAQAFARAWNLGLVIVPPLRRLWGGLVWAIGRVPEEAER